MYISTIKQSKTGQEIEILYTDNNIIYKRDELADYDSHGRLFDYCVYIWVKKSNIINNLRWNIEIIGDIVYIGKGIFTDNPIDKCRALAHKNDLLSEITNNPEYKCYIFAIGSTEIESLCLESWLISDFINKGYSLSKKNTTFLYKNQLINKIRGRKIDYNKYLII